MNMAYRTISTTKRSGVIVFLHPKKTDSKSPYLLYLLKLNNDELENKGQERVFELRNVCWVTMCGLIPRASRSHQLLSVVFLSLLVPLYLFFYIFSILFSYLLESVFSFLSRCHPIYSSYRGVSFPVCPSVLNELQCSFVSRVYAAFFTMQITNRVARGPAASP
ncbi:hypothetical protein CLUG_01654 [Clavispora lusitaniae ATCC 42720]|uniref:Uncharacterized protein n=1 Tax=Clavispora lusitaniae (strain ATCC 42720) TaxID=306902 RepID=C4Y0C2_CLAL4|nr:uncharacterized protein CLUG_01654 [Clavispora lusitaniae ATCC 42720]EEQ37531.1 hypothetical protein CLUG_01654 [Clavispora lusitaniae ATCC 42720]